MLLAVIAVLVAVFFAGTGRGGELSRERADHAPLDLGPVSPADVALLRPPTALWGYNVQVTDEALERIALAMRDRDVTISYLQQRLAGLIPETARDLPRTPRPAPSPPSPQALPDQPGVADARGPGTGPEQAAGDDADTQRLSRDDPGAGRGPSGQQAPAGGQDTTDPTDPQDPAGPVGG
jgi:hypothetical protein